MRRRQHTVYRGLYGPHPAALMPNALLFRQRLAAWSAAARCTFSFATNGNALEPAAPDAHVLEELRRLRFRPLVPAKVLCGWPLAAVDSLHDCADLLTLVYETRPRRSFRVSQRPKWLPLVEELRLARVPATRVRCGSMHMFVVHGVYTGEPIDHAYSVGHRRSVALELGEVVAELREVTGRGPGLRGLMTMARGMAEQFGHTQCPADPRPASVQYHRREGDLQCQTTIGVRTTA